MLPLRMGYWHVEASVAFVLHMTLFSFKGNNELNVCQLKGILEVSVTWQKNELRLCGWELVSQHLWAFCRPSYAPHICPFSFQRHNWSSVNFTVVPVHLNWAKLLADCTREFSVELYGERHLRWVQDVVVQKLRLQGERACTGGHGAAHQMDWTQATRAKSFFLLIGHWLSLLLFFFNPYSNFKTSTVKIPVWSLSLTLTLNPSDYKGRYSLCQLQKTDRGYKKTTHTTTRRREVCVDRRWMRGISYLERSSVSSGPSHQDWTLRKAYRFSVAS